jgi:HTH-type transcriptional regulator / antitoxin HigA
MTEAGRHGYQAANRMEVDSPARVARPAGVPDEVSAPGETLLDVLEERGIKPNDLAERTGQPRKRIAEVIQGRAAITPEIALELDRALGIPAGFWKAREALYREFLARREEADRLRGE